MKEHNSKISYELQNDSEQLSNDNKIIAFHFFNTCQCGSKIELLDNMFSDGCDADQCSSMCGWKYKCGCCGKINNIWEGAFDGFVDSCFENDFVFIREED